MANRLAATTSGSQTRPSLGVDRLTVRQLLSGKESGLNPSEPHRLRFHASILVIAGAGHHMVDFSTVPLAPGDLLILRAGQVHAFSSSRSMEGEILTFTPEFAGSLSKIPEAPAAIDAILQAAPRLALSNSSATCVRKWFHEFSADLAPSNQPFSVPRIACAFGLLACRLAALPEFVALAADSGRVHPELVRNFLQLLETGYLDRRDPAWYAVTLNVSPRTLDRHLVKALKNNCRELIAKRLVLEAKRLMADPDSQLQSVAHALRFEDVAGFSRFFHNNAGLSPRDFKTQIPNWLV